MDRVRVLFLPWSMRTIPTPESQVREIARRLIRSASTVRFGMNTSRIRGCGTTPASACCNWPSTARLCGYRELLAGYDIIAYVDYSPATYLFLHLPRVGARRAKAVFHRRLPLLKIMNRIAGLRFLYDGIVPAVISTRDHGICLPGRPKPYKEDCELQRDHRPQPHAARLRAVATRDYDSQSLMIRLRRPASSTYSSISFRHDYATPPESILRRKAGFTPLVFRRYHSQLVSSGSSVLPGRTSPVAGRAVSGIPT